MGATSFPRAEISITEANRFASGGNIIAVLTVCKAEFKDRDPVLVHSGEAAVDAVGYSDGACYAAMHCAETGQPVLMVPMEIATKGVSTAAVHGTSNPSGVLLGSATVTIVDDPINGVMSAVDGMIMVREGGTIGTPGIVLDLTLDGGVSWRTIRLNSAMQYVIPHIGVTIQFGAGTMVAGEFDSWTSTAPTWDASGIDKAREKLARGQVQVRTWIVIGEVNTSKAKVVLDAVNAYEAENERFVLARCDAQAKKTEPTWRQTASASDALFSDVNGWRLAIGFGHRRKLCRLTRWNWRRPVSWAASLREYGRGMDIHLTTWWRDMGPLAGWFSDDSDDEYDERVHTGALFGRFVAFTSLANGPRGYYIAKDVTRGETDSTFLLPNNVQVTNEACSVANAATVRILGQSLILNQDGTASAESIANIEGAVNAALSSALMTEHVPGRGPRASSVRWTMSPADDLRGPAAVVNGILELNLRGTVSQIRTMVRVA